MIGEIVVTGRDQQMGESYGLKVQNEIFPVPNRIADRAGFFRKIGKEVPFMTDRETGEAIIFVPEPYFTLPFDND